MQYLRLLTKQPVRRYGTGVPTQRCSVVRGESIRCPGVFDYHLGKRTDGSVQSCPLCGAPHRWSAAMEEWVVDMDFVAGE